MIYCIVLLALLAGNGCTGYSSRTDGQDQPKENIKGSGTVGEFDGAGSLGERFCGHSRARKVRDPHFSSDREALSAQTAILTIDSTVVRWPEFYFWLKFIEKHYRKAHRIEAIIDWRTEQNGMPLKDFILHSAVGYACKERAIEAKARELGVELDSDDWMEIEQARKEGIQTYGRWEYQRMIRKMYVSDEVFGYLTRMDHLGKRLFAHLYGERGEKCPLKDGSVCEQLFRSRVDEWCAAMVVEYEDAYYQIDPESLFR